MTDSQPAPAPRSLPPHRARTATVKGKCYKCKDVASEVKMRTAELCRPCFENSVMSKFNRSMGRASGINDRPTKRLMLCVSGGRTSMLMMHLLARSQQRAHDFHRFSEVVVCVLDERLGGNDEECLAIDLVEKEAGKWGFRLVVSRIDECLGVDRDELTSAFRSEIGTATARDAFMATLKRRAFLRLAKQHDCLALAIGDCQLRLAINALAYMTEGRGYALPLMLGTARDEEEHDGVILLRPMKELNEEDMKNYLAANHVPYVEASPPPSSSSSIRQLTETFVRGLDKDYPSTVSTVMRTMSKLNFTGKDDKNEECVMCGYPVERGCLEWRQRFTVGAESSESSPTSDAASALCYACSVDSQEWKVPHEASTLLEKLRKMGNFNDGVPGQ